MKKILVTGAKGQLGSELQVLASNYPLFEWVFTDRGELNLGLVLNKPFLPPTWLHHKH